MALPSQAERSGDSGRAVSYQTGGGGGSRVPMLIIGLLVVAGATGSIYWLAQSGPKDASALTAKNGEKPSDKGGLVAKKPDVKNDLKPDPKPLGNSPVVVEPVRISLGSAQPATPTPSPTGTPATNPPANPPANPAGGQPLPGPTNPPAATPSGTPGAAPGSTPPAGETGKPAGIDVTSPSGAPGNPPGTAPGTNPGSNPGTAPSGPGSPLPATGSTSEVMNLMAEGDRKQKAGDLLGARALLSKALLNSKTSKSDQEALRTKLTTINQDLIFSAKVTPGDPMCEEYTIEAGDGLEKIARKRALVTDWRLIERINKVDSTKLKVGKKLKLVRGPFHAVVTKSDYRLDLYWGVPSDPENWIYVKSFKVGLGPNTPVGDFTVKTASRQVNPPWTNPQTGEKFAADDPKNPIGERWVGIEGKGEAAKFKGFGIHGTIEPDSIGQSKSMGCVRMLDDDVALVYTMLMDPVSVVKLVP